MARQIARGAIFDMDGVLVDSGVHHRAAWRALLDELGETPAHHDYWRLTIGRPGAEAVPLLLGRAVPAAEARVLARRKHEHYLKLARDGVAPIAGVVEFVEALAARAIPRAVATSASRHDAHQLLERLHLRRHFEVIVAAEDVSRGKPDPEVYLRAARGLGLAPGACLVFEDSVVGVHAAREAGMTVVGVTTAHAEGELRAAGAAHVIDSFEGVTWPV
ncbi:MAG: HAD family phosphatase [Candidatus Rokubacteria bacterium]|nr:HAD family phosphatase [Candidatus Rokubacteria bacterium]